MRFSMHADGKRAKGELLVLPFFKSQKGVIKACPFDDQLVNWQVPVRLKDFTATAGEVLLLYDALGKIDRIALIGLGEAHELTTEKLRRIYAACAKLANSKKINAISIWMPHLPQEEAEELAHKKSVDLLRGISEGMLLANYAFDKCKHDLVEKNPSSSFKELSFIGLHQEQQPSLQKTYAICQSVAAVRDLVNGNADDITPQYLASYAQEMARQMPAVSCQVLGKQELEAEKMGLILAVNRGSRRDPVLIQLAYKGNPKSKEHILLVGKGITYDTGGLNIKPTGSMETMKCDMAGGAVVLEAIRALATMGWPLNVTALVPATENCTDGNSYKPGDVYQSYSGKTVEIGNTDAEGRLVLADAITYGLKKLSPSLIIDLATLTGAIDIALGPEAAGLFCNDDQLGQDLMAAAQDTHERLWPMPLFEEYRDALKSDVADIKNVGGRSAGSSLAAMFLQEFVGKGLHSIPWAHLDIASVAYATDSKRYHPKGGTGYGLRLLMSFFEKRAQGLPTTKKRSSFKK